MAVYALCVRNDVEACLHPATSGCDERHQFCSNDIDRQVVMHDVGTMCLNIQQNTDSMRSYKVYLYSRKPMLPMHRRFSLFAKIENATEVQPTVNYAQLLAHVAMLLIFKSKINRRSRALSKGRPPMRILAIPKKKLLIKLSFLIAILENRNYC